MTVGRTGSSLASIQLVNTENEQPNFLSDDDSSTQNDEPTEIVIQKAREQTEIEKLEAELAELGHDWTHHSTQLQNSLALDIMRQPVFRNYSLKMIDSTKLIVIAAASFLAIRLLYMTDVLIFLALFEAISLIILFIGLTSEAHYFFWPFVLSCVLESFVVNMQLLFISMRISMTFDEIRASKAFLAHMEVGFTPYLTDKMSNVLDFMQLGFYMLCKMTAFDIATVAILLLAWDLRKKESDVEEQRKRLSQIQRQKIVLVSRLELLRANA
ncbi:hypothetical protein M3Y96_00178600 [Aphelenchoides besseyi]|nr:hypothetical protein M3Y96_00178600 [Aphelenchoides besseyi]